MNKNHFEYWPKTCSAASTAATPPWASSSASISSATSGSRVETELRMERRTSMGEIPRPSAERRGRARRELARVGASPGDRRTYPETGRWE